MSVIIRFSDGRLVRLRRRPRACRRPDLSVLPNTPTMPRSDVTDGTIEDWEELFGEPSLTSLDFTGFTSYQGSGESMDYNPSDLDFRIYLGWNGASDRIYVGAICIDDVYIGEEEMIFQLHGASG